MLTLLLLCLLGFVLLYFGAEWLVSGSSGLARSYGVSAIIIGLTVVAFGTSAPELVISLVASIKGKSMIAVGNVVGSNICNIALVLGLAALFNPITCDRMVFRRDIPIMLGVSLILLFLSVNSHISRLEGVVLLSGIVAYTWFNYRLAKKQAQEVKCASGLDLEHCDESEDVVEEEQPASRAKLVFLIIVGIAGVVLGAQLVVDTAEELMRIWGVSEKFIGLTIVAFGTSLPELATSVVAAMKKELDLSIGNLVGSNVFNILSVLGAAALFRPVPIPGGFFDSGLWIDYIVMFATSAMPWFMLRKTNTISRANGALLLAVYAGYLFYLILKA